MLQLSYPSGTVRQRGREHDRPNAFVLGFKAMAEAGLAGYGALAVWQVQPQAERPVRIRASVLVAIETQGHP